MPNVGDLAPSFELESDQGKKVSSASLAGGRYVVYFYPRDDTPGCTVEAIEFTRQKPAFDALGVKVFGASKDSIASHCKFRDKHKLGIPLLSDPTLALHKAYEAYGEKTMYGKKVEGVIRSTFIVGADGKIEKAWKSVKVAGHVDAVLEALGGAPAKPAAPPKKPAAPPKKPAAPPKKPTAPPKKPTAPAKKSAAAKKPAVKKPAKKN
ncbi:MAG: peroxiredoxin [Polyangiaceae bacterium]